MSCQKIVFNLHKSYQLQKKLELLNFNYSVDQTPNEIIKTARSIVASEPDVLVIMDHQPHPIILMKLVLPYLDKTKVKIIFHVFGDFTLFYAQWDKLQRDLEGFKVEFIVASDRQKNLIDKFLNPPLESHVCPFPVDKREFSYNPALRKSQRKEWGLSDDDIAYVFTGRLSRQKRTHTLLKSFSEFLATTKATNAHLFLYGDTDHIGDQFLGLWEVEGEYFRKINKIYKSLPIEVQEKIHFMGSVPNVELKGVYQGADYLVNLSVHNDEDYGMSVAEAQCSGLPGILTDWGGLASFFHPDMPEATEYIPVKIGKKSKLIHYESILKAFEKTYRNGHFTRNEELSQKSLEKFGVEACSTYLTKVLKSETPPFVSFSPFFSKVLVNYLFSPTPYVDRLMNINKNYREIYSSYVRNN